jgi:hypothetical protein
MPPSLTTASFYTARDHLSNPTLWLQKPTFFSILTILSATVIRPLAILRGGQQQAVEVILEERPVP